MITKPITAKVRVTYKKSPRDVPKELKNITKIIDFAMTDKDTKMTVGVGMTYPGILGDYSSMNVHVSIDVPVDTEELDMEKMKETLDPYRDMVSTYVMQNINEACEQVGKDKPFGDL